MPVIYFSFVRVGQYFVCKTDLFELHATKQKKVQSTNNESRALINCLKLNLQMTQCLVSCDSIICVNYQYLMQQTVSVAYIVVVLTMSPTFSDHTPQYQTF